MIEHNNAFEHELEHLLNQYSIENYAGDTPDFVLAAYLVDCINTFSVAVSMRNNYYKHD